MDAAHVVRQVAVAPFLKQKDKKSCSCTMSYAPATLFKRQRVTECGKTSKQNELTQKHQKIPMDYSMEEVHEHPRLLAIHPWQWRWQWRLFSLLSSPPPAPATRPRRPPNHVSWDETAAAHLYSASLPGVRKEEIRVEVEDARYLVIRTELVDDDGDGGDGEEEVDGRRRRNFARRFRLPGMVDADGISAEYAHGVLTVTVPRMHTRTRPVVNLLGSGPSRDPVARAA